MTGLAAIILAGGRSSRMGQDKAALLWQGETAASRLRALAREVGAQDLVLAGGPYGEPDPVPFSGPVGGITHVAASLQGADRLLVLAIDAPTIDAADLRPLLDTPSPGASYSGLPLPLVVSYSAVPWTMAPDAPLRRFVAEAGLAQLPPAPDRVQRLRGANTPAEFHRLRLAANSGAAR